MKREIKFRAWVKPSYWGNLKGLMATCFSIDLPFKKWFLKLNDPLYKYQSGDFTAGKDFEIMQYTGLEDKNGVEIYEGDIIRWRTRDGNLVKNSVGFADGGFVMDGPVVVNDKKYYTFLITILSSDAEVIGNIYENPDLIKSELDFLD